eukprot:975881-Rhodomonas_salina.2
MRIICASTDTRADTPAPVLGLSSASTLGVSKSLDKVSKTLLLHGLFVDLRKQVSVCLPVVGMSWDPGKQNEYAYMYFNTVVPRWFQQRQKRKPGTGNYCP